MISIMGSRMSTTPKEENEGTGLFFVSPNHMHNDTVQYNQGRTKQSEETSGERYHNDKFSPLNLRKHIGRLPLEESSICTLFSKRR